MSDMKISEFNELQNPVDDAMLAGAYGGNNFKLKLSTLRAWFGIVTQKAAGFMSADDKTKLDGIASQATKNSADSTLLNRQNHTGQQDASTVTGLAKVATSGSYKDLKDAPSTGIPVATNTQLGGVKLGPGQTTDGDGTLRISRFAERAAFDPVMKAGAVALSNNNLTATVPGGKQVVALGTTGMKAGKWYFETTFVSGTSSGNAAVGVCPRNEAMDAQVGYDDGQGTIGKFQSSGNVYRDGGTNSGSGAAFNVAGDTVGVAIDATSRTAWFRVNGGVWNGSASNDPATGVGGYPIGGTFPLFPAICSDVASVWTVNFTGPFAAASPTGFIPWSQGSLQLSLGDCADIDLTGAKAGDTLKLSTTGVWKPSSVA
ncbi:Uncharacterised protein [Burkholderia pseudomallei]|nr:Uncharacterised protein [Burkholderia pseudomallei]